MAAKPPDRSHNFGHTKAEYLSAVFEGVMIVVAAVVIVATAVDRLLHPEELDEVGMGLAISVGATVVNAVVDAVRPLGINDIEMPCTPQRVWRAIQGGAR